MRRFAYLNHKCWQVTVPDRARLWTSDDNVQSGQARAARRATTHTVPSPHTRTPNRSAKRCSSTHPPNVRRARSTACIQGTQISATRISCCTRPLLKRRLYRPKDLRNLPIKRRGLHLQHRPPRMQDHIHRKRHRRRVPPHTLTHTPLDAIPFHRHAQHLADSQPHSRPRSIAPAILRPQRIEVAHLPGMLFPRRPVNTLIVSMFPQAEQRVGSLP